jgi:hypothetical protein
MDGDRHPDAADAPRVRARQTGASRRDAQTTSLPTPNGSSTWSIARGSTCTDPPLTRRCSWRSGELLRRARMGIRHERRGNRGSARRAVGVVAVGSRGDINEVQHARWQEGVANLNTAVSCANKPSRCIASSMAGKVLLGAHEPAVHSRSGAAAMQRVGPRSRRRSYARASATSRRSSRPP